MAQQEIWTIKRVLDWTCGYLERKGDEHPRLSAEWLLANVTGMSRVELYVNFDKPLEEGELSAMHAAIERRATGEPLQYVTGEMPFRHIVLRCERGVLIPRPETEVLVDAALEGVDEALARAAEKSAEAEKGADAEKDDEPVPPLARVLEVGTGTGCIALSIASERPGVHVTATDLSPRAIELATRNREALGLEGAVDIVECDLASGVDPELMGSFAVLVSNPPYFADSLPCPDDKRRVARHAGSLDLPDLLRDSLALLAPGGLIALILPFDRREALLAHAHVASLYPVAETHVSSVEGKAPKRLLVALSPRIAEAARAIPLAIETPEHHYTEGFTRLMRDFYLKI